MGNTMNVSQDLHEMITAIKRVRPSDWIVNDPPPKRVRLTIFDEDGAKAIKIPDRQHAVIQVS
jgi:hypothetical protein